MNIRLSHSGDIESIVDFQFKMAKETEDMELDINKLSSASKKTHYILINYSE
jgi:hypothetical protein